MSAESPSYPNSISSFVHREFRCDGDAEQYVDADAYGDSCMDGGGAADADAEYTSQLEKDYCTNFTCCGLTLADLHELVSHFEECHVMVVDPSGRLGGPDGLSASLGMHMGVESFPGTDMGSAIGTYMGARIGAGTYTRTSYDTCTPTDESCSAATPQSSSNSAPSTAPSSSLNSPISPYTSPSPIPNQFPTLTSAFSPSDTRECESAFASVTIAAESYDYSSDAAKDYLATHAQIHAQNRDQSLSKEPHVLGLSFDTLLHPSAYTMSASALPPPPGSVVPEHTIYATNPVPSSITTKSSRSPASTKTAKTDVTASSVNSQPFSPTPIHARHPSLSIITDVPSVPAPNSDQNGRTADRSSSSKRRRSAPTKGALRQREKTHKCPRSGCLKSYLNFNGLKYHLEKGTCDFGQN